VRFNHIAIAALDHDAWFFEAGVLNLSRQISVAGSLISGGALSNALNGLAARCTVSS
jgi:hypothetical protein